MKEIIRSDSNPAWDPTMSTERSAPEFNHVAEVTGEYITCMGITIHSDNTGPSQVNVYHGDVVRIAYNKSGVIDYITGIVLRSGELRGTRKKLYLDIQQINGRCECRIYCDNIRSISVIEHVVPSNYSLIVNFPDKYLDLNCMFKHELAQLLQDNNITLYGICGSSKFTSQPIIAKNREITFNIPNGLVNGIYALYVIAANGTEVPNTLISTENLGYIFVNNEYNLFIPFSIKRSDKDTPTISRVERNGFEYNLGATAILNFTNCVTTFEGLMLTSRLYSPIKLSIKSVSENLKDSNFTSFIFYNIPNWFTVNMKIDKMMSNVPSTFTYVIPNSLGHITDNITGIIYNKENTNPVELSLIGVKSPKEDCCCRACAHTILTYNKIGEHFIPLSEEQQVIVVSSVNITATAYPYAVENIAKVLIPTVNKGDKYSVCVFYLDEFSRIILLYNYIFSFGRYADESNNSVDVLDLELVHKYPDGIRVITKQVSDSTVCKFIPFSFNFARCSVYLGEKEIDLSDEHKYSVAILDNNGKTVAKGYTNINNIENKFGNQQLLLEYKYHILRVTEYETGTIYETGFSFDENGMVSFSNEIRLVERKDVESQTKILRIDCFVSDSAGNEIPNINNDIISFGAIFDDDIATKSIYCQTLKKPTDVASNVTDIVVYDKHSMSLNCTAVATMQDTENAPNTYSLILNSFEDYIQFDDLSSNKNIQIISEDSAKKIIGYRMPLRRINVGVILKLINTLDNRYYHLKIAHLKPDNTIPNTPSEGVWIDKTKLTVLSLRDGDHISIGAFDKVYPNPDNGNFVSFGQVKMEMDRVICDKEKWTFEYSSNTLTIDVGSIVDINTSV